MPRSPKSQKRKTKKSMLIETSAGLFEVAQTMSSVLDLNSLLRLIVTVAAEKCDAAKCTLMLIEDEKFLVLKVGVGIDEDKLRNVRTQLGKGIAGQVAQTGVPIWVKNIETDERFKRQSSAKYQTASFLSVPLVVKDKVIGVLNVNDKKDNQPFSKDDFELITILASQAAISVDNARLYTDAHRMRSHLQNILDNLVEAVLVIDSKKKCTFMNSRVNDLLHPISKKTIEVEYEKVFSKSVIDILNTVVKDTMAFGSVIEREVEIENTNGKKIPIGISGTLLKVPNSTSSVILVARDLTMTKELAKLQVLNQMKSEFISTVSHELRTPLTAIKGSVSLVAEERTGKINDLQREMLTLVKRNTDRLARMIDDLLEISRAEAGKPMRIAITKISISMLLSDILKLFAQQAAQSELNLNSNIPDNIPDIEADPARLQQVIINLIGNAIKFTPTGGSITVTVQEYDDSVTVSVKDTGIGIPKEELQKVFDTYHQVVRPNQEAHIKGFGLGLAISKRIVDAHQGKIWVESDTGQGSDFIFRIPKKQPVLE